MIPIPFWIWVAAFVLVSVTLLLWLWLSFPPDKELPHLRRREEKKKYLRCPYCGAVIEKDKENITMCPVCKSYV